MRETRSREVRALVISMGGARQEAIEEMLREIGGFATPVFSPGVPSRSLRSRCQFLKICQQAGLLPEEEWERLQYVCDNDNPSPEQSSALFDCLKDLPVIPGRRGSEADVKLHYCVELWRKAKTINRGRSVLGCILAHLVALKTFVDGDFDVLLEDNVRAPLDGEAARRIRETIVATVRYEMQCGSTVHMKYFGWLGSTLNLQWNFQSHLPHRRVSSESDCSVAPFPTPQHIDDDIECGRYVVESDTPNSIAQGPGKVHSKPGGTPVWGAYAYWVSRTGYDAVLSTLRKDVGSILWKMKSARYYSVKPIDKILPRQIMASLGEASVVIATSPAFFRAPMLTSKIHAKWDPEFCKSTEYELGQTGLVWSSLWLTEAERKVVEHRQQTGEWLTPSSLALGVAS